jgi:pyrroloquinoline quinone biosynthesis protein D
MTGPALARKARLRWDARRDAWMLLAPERGIALSASAAAILKLCDGERSAEAIAAQLAAESGADVETVRRDVAAFLEEMRKKSLVVLP